MYDKMITYSVLSCRYTSFRHILYYGVSQPFLFVRMTVQQIQSVNAACLVSGEEDGHVIHNV